jgi:hypothetical protein
MSQAPAIRPPTSAALGGVHGAVPPCGRSSVEFIGCRGEIGRSGRAAENIAAGEPLRNDHLTLATVHLV